MDAQLKRRTVDLCRNREQASLLSQIMDLRSLGVLSPDAVVDLLESAEDSARYRAESLLSRMSSTVWQILPDAADESASHPHRLRFAIQVAGLRWNVTCRRSPSLRVSLITRA
jgi:hypothetical protein